MRLPSTLYMTDYQGSQVQIYPRFDNYSYGGFAVFLETSPNCQARACSFALITVAKDYDEYKKDLLSSPILSTEQLLRIERTRNRHYETWTEADKELLTQAEGAVLVRERITLTKGVKAHYIIRNAMGASTPSSGAVIWEQGGFIYGVIGPGGIDEKNQIEQRWKTELINTARSMSTEPPIVPKKVLAQSSCKNTIQKVVNQMRIKGVRQVILDDQYRINNAGNPTNRTGTITLSLSSYNQHSATQDRQFYQSGYKIDNILRSPVLLKTWADLIVANCEDMAEVTFAEDQSDRRIDYAIQANGKTRKRECSSSNDFEVPLPWNQQHCI